MMRRSGYGVMWMLLGIATLGCGGEDKQARLAAASHVVMGRVEPPPVCRLVMSYMARDPKAYAPFAALAANSEDALRELRLKASDSGANYVVVDFVAGPSAQGRLYACPPEAVPPPGAVPAVGVMVVAPPMPPPPDACKPPCSPGYACVDGTCVSACNPPCPASKQCGADRVCY